MIEPKNYPLKRDMTLDEIKAVPQKKILKASLKIAKKIKKKYKEVPNYYVDMDLAGRVLGFMTSLKHTGGSLGGVPFRLLPFQVEFIVESLCVLHEVSHFRKHKEAIMAIPRKNGKTELGAGLNLWMMFGDKEPQKEIYSIASETQQATILYSATQQMLKNVPFLLNKSKTYKAEKKITKEDGDFVDLYRVLSAVAGTKDGLKTSTVFADEPHAYPDSALYDVVSEGMAHRSQPLAFLLSTAGYNKQGFFHKKLLYARQVMQGIIKDDSIYLMDFSLQDDDDWTNEELWIKANPALGYGVKMDYLRDKFHKALHSATDEVSFKTKHLNLWVDSAITWIKSADWTRSNKLGVIDIETLKGRQCYVGLDLSSTTDLTALVYVFPNDEGGYEVLSRFFIPMDTAKKRSKEDRVSYLDWIRDGWITGTHGNIIDYEYIYNQVIKDSALFDIRELAFDRWNSAGIITRLEEEGINCVGFGQGFKSMSSPVKAIEALVLQEKLNHGNNPVLTWNVSNVLIVQDGAENVKMDKGKSQERIDGSVALAMAIGRAETYKDETADWESLVG